MLLRGTELYERKQEFQLKEYTFQFGSDGDLLDTQGNDQRLLLGIPHVTSSSTFTEDDWFQMRRIASQL
jgi:hypothetical protein